MSGCCKRARKIRVYHCHDGTYRYMVAALNQREAARLLGVTVGCLRRSGGRYTDARKVAIALSEPGRVWKQLIDFTAVQPWLFA